MLRQVVFAAWFNNSLSRRDPGVPGMHFGESLPHRLDRRCSLFISLTLAFPSGEDVINSENGLAGELLIDEALESQKVICSVSGHRSISLGPSQGNHRQKFGVTGTRDPHQEGRETNMTTVW